MVAKALVVVVKRNNWGEIDVRHPALVARGWDRPPLYNNPGLDCLLALYQAYSF